MIYSCALIFFLCSSGCLLTISLFNNRWMVVEVALKQTSKVKVTTYVTIGLWETRRVRYYHYYYHHYHPFYHHHGMVVYHENTMHKASPVIQVKVQPPPPPPPPPPTTTPAPVKSTAAPASTAAAVPAPAVTKPAAVSKEKAATVAAPKASLELSYQTSFLYHLSEKTLLQVSEANTGALIAIRVLLFVCVGLTFGALILLLVTACNDTSVIRHRYKEKKLAFTMAGLCAIALLLTTISWAVFLGTVYHSVLAKGTGSDSLSSGFVCCVLSSICLIISIVMAACTVDEN